MVGSNVRKRLANHLNEYLVFGGIPADEYRILAIFNGQKEPENIAERIDYSSWCIHERTSAVEHKPEGHDRYNFSSTGEKMVRKQIKGDRKRVYHGS
jgi:hypothetical protein